MKDENMFEEVEAQPQVEATGSEPKIMSKKRVAILAGCAAGALAVGLATTIAVNTVAKKAPESESAQSSQGTQVVVVDNELSKRTEEATLSYTDIKGIEKTTLSEEECRQIGPYLNNKIFYDAGPADATVSIEESDVVYEDGKREYTIKVMKPENDPRAYKMTIGDTWALKEVDPAEEAKAQAASAASASSSSASAASEGSGTGETGYNSQNKVEEFDPSTAVQLSQKDRANATIGAEVAGVLFQDLNEYMSSAGISANSAEDVYIMAKTVSKQDNILSFNVMVKTGRDRLVFECTYDTDTMRNVMTWHG